MNKMNNGGKRGGGGVMAGEGVDYCQGWGSTMMGDGGHGLSSWYMEPPYKYYLSGKSLWLRKASVCRLVQALNV